MIKLFITIDGPNGVGKTTLINNLTLQLKTCYKVFSTKEPSDSEFGNYVRKNEEKIKGRDYAELIAKDREWHIEHIIKPKLSENDILICDRYIESSLALQGFDGVPFEEIWELNCQFLRPDISIVLLASSTLITDRLNRREILTYYEKEMSRENEILYYKKAVEFLKTKGFHSYILLNNSLDDMEHGIAKIIKLINDFYSIK